MALVSEKVGETLSLPAIEAVIPNWSGSTS
jgi:hypothetical protein